ncbi:DNA replication complex GINS protein psf3, partial [Blastomyces percursus]
MDCHRFLYPSLKKLSFIYLLHPPLLELAQTPPSSPLYTPRQSPSTRPNPSRHIQRPTLFRAPTGSTDPGQGLRDFFHLPIDSNPAIAPWLDGEDLLNLILSQGLQLLNPADSPTHQRGGTLDLSFCLANAACRIAPELHSTSDHETLVISITNLQNGPIADKKPSLATCNVERFLQLLSPLTSLTSPNVEEEPLDIVKSLQQALLGSCPSTQGAQSHRGPWWTDSVRAARRNFHQARRLGPCIEEQQLFRKEIRKAKRAWNRKRIEEALSLPEINPTGQITLLRDTLLARQLDAEGIPPDTPVVPGRDILWALITKTEAFSATCQTLSTSPVADGVPARFLKAAWPALGERITQLFQNCIDQEIHPQAFKEAERDRTLPTSYRPIALLSCLGKGLERLLAKRLSYLAIRYQILGKDQCSAVQRRSATDLTTALACDVQELWNQKRLAGIITLDVKGAFDGVLRNRLVTRLREQGWPTCVTNWVKSSLLQRSARISLDNIQSDTFPILCGLPQGSPVSPILFLLYLEPLLRLSEGHFEYADGIAILNSGRDLAEVGDKLQNTLKSTLDWGIDNGDRTIAPNDTTRWLRIFFDRKLQFREHIRRAYIKSRIITQHLKSLNGVSFEIPTVLLGQAVQGCVFSSLFYGAETWFSEHTSKEYGVRQPTQHQQILSPRDQHQTATSGSRRELNLEEEKTVTGKPGLHPHDVLEDEKNIASKMSYYDLDAILTDAQKLPCTFELEVPGLGYLDGNVGEDIKPGTRIDLPLWLGEMLAVGARTNSSPLVNLELPSALSEKVLNALKADPRTVDLRSLAPHFYRLGVRMLELVEAEEMVDVLMETFKKRAMEIADHAHNSHGSLGDGVEFLRGLDETERQ